MRFPNFKAAFLFLALAGIVLLNSASAWALDFDPLTEYRTQGVVLRKLDGSIARDAKVVMAFRNRWACPSTQKHFGACPGWAVDHVIPLSCGGVDAVMNLQWLPNEIKAASGTLAKDRFERRVYGGQGLTARCQ